MGIEPETSVARVAAEFAETAFEKHYRALHRYLVRRLPRKQDASDLMQEVFLRVLRLDRSELVRKPQAYVYGIASHVVHEHRMREQNDRVTYDSHTLEQLAEHPAELATDELADRLALQREFERSLALLSPTHQAVLLLHKRDGMSREEVAAALNLSVHTVKKYVCQALAQVRAGWREE